LQLPFAGLTELVDFRSMFLMLAILSSRSFAFAIWRRHLGWRIELLV
jgi:hypothetical protein